MRIAKDIRLRVEDNNLGGRRGTEDAEFFFVRGTVMRVPPWCREAVVVFCCAHQIDAMLLWEDGRLLGMACI